MTSPIITTKTRQVTVTKYKWSCPGCDRDMTQDSIPEPQDFLCYSCVLDNEESDFKKAHGFLIGSTIVQLKWSVGMGFRGVTVEDEHEDRWDLNGSLLCLAIETESKE